MQFKPAPLSSATKASSRLTGFTLIELLVVVAIIAILAGLLFPAVARVQKRSKTVACLSNLRQAGVLIRLYTGEHDNTFPFATLNNQSYVVALSAYLPASEAQSSKNIFVSPAAVYPTTGNVGRNFTYAVHNALFGGSQTKGQSPLRVTDVQRPSEVIMMANGAQIKANGYNCAYTFYNPYQLNQGLDDPSLNLDKPIPVDESTNVDDYAGMGYLRYVQNDNTAVNALMVDGHAETIAKGKVLWRNLLYSR